MNVYFYFCCQRKITNRPLAGTVRRGKTPKEDLMLEKELLSDEKQCAEHIMLVDLGRNDVGKVCTCFSAECKTPKYKEKLDMVHLYQVSLCPFILRSMV